MTKPSVRQLIAENTLSQMAATVVSLGFGLVTAAVLSRYLGVERFGKFNYLFAFYYFFLALNDLGINTVVVRELSQKKHPSGEVLGSVFLFKLALSLFSLGVAWAIVFWMGFEGDFRRGLLLYGLILPLLTLQLPTVLYQVHLKLARLSVLSVINKGIALAFTLTAVWLRFGITGLAIALVLAEAFYAFLLFRDARPLIEPDWKWNSRVVRGIFHSGIPIGFTGFLVAVINRSSFILLERFQDLHQLGLFSAATKVTAILETLPLTVMGTLYPLMSRYAAEDPSRLKSLHQKSSFSLASIGLAAAVSVSFASPLLIRVIFGRAYLAAAPILAVLVWATAFLYAAICSGSLLISLGCEKINLGITLAAAPLNVLLNLRLIPRWGALGSAWAAVITYGFILICALAAANRSLQAKNKNRPPSTPFYASLKTWWPWEKLSA